MADNAEEQNLDETIRPDAANKEATNEDLKESFNATPRPGGYIRIGGKQRRFDSEPKIQDPVCTCGVIDCREKFMTSRGTGTNDLPSPDMISFSATKHTTRSYRLNRTLEIRDWGSPNTEEEGGDLEKPVASKEEEGEQGSTFYLIVVLISCVMLLASGAEVSKDILETTRQYLECIRDEEGDHPPNVQGLLNHISMVMGDGS